eukprot:NODE_4669_length_651_cov_364.458054.p3 GENE.NODE_4669_length_651_cov_364.458054~~NODE_4669_length_651_cov_364.458054.p3  ORF type:complete len:90 (+),score=11.78 NODE_4669_length_651_cov_364.458054:3-272(+)
MGALVWVQDDRPQPRAKAGGAPNVTARRLRARRAYARQAAQAARRGSEAGAELQPAEGDDLGRGAAPRAGGGERSRAPARHTWGGARPA